MDELENHIPRTKLSGSAMMQDKRLEETPELIQHHVGKACPERARIGFSLTQDIKIIQGVIAPSGKRLGVPEQGALADLASSCQDDHTMLLNSRLELWSDPAREVL